MCVCVCVCVCSPRSATLSASTVYIFFWQFKSFTEMIIKLNAILMSISTDTVGWSTLLELRVWLCATQNSQHVLAWQIVYFVMTSSLACHILFSCMVLGMAKKGSRILVQFYYAIGESPNIMIP